MGHELEMMSKVSNIVDVYVGARLRMRRTMLGMSQSRLGELLGVTFQQIQKYEKGSNRISASRLQHTARVLEVSPGYFFEGAPANSAEPGFAETPRNPTLSTSWPPPKVFSSIGRFCGFGTPRCDGALSTWSLRWRRPKTRAPTTWPFGKSNKLAKTA